MTRGRPKADLVITDDERTQLTSIARSRSLPPSLSGRGCIVLSSADDEAIVAPLIPVATALVPIAGLAPARRIHNSWEEVPLSTGWA